LLCLSIALRTGIFPAVFAFRSVEQVEKTGQNPIIHAVIFFLGEVAHELRIAPCRLAASRLAEV